MESRMKKMVDVSSPQPTTPPRSTTPSPTSTSTSTSHTTTTTTTPSDRDPSPTRARLHRLYGPNLPTTPPRRFAAHLKSERKYFDSGDYAISKAGRGDGVDLGAVGELHPEPGMIPHPSSSGVHVQNEGGQGPVGMGAGVGKRRKSSLGGVACG